MNPFASSLLLLLLLLITATARFGQATISSSIISRSSGSTRTGTGTGAGTGRDSNSLSITPMTMTILHRIGRGGGTRNHNQNTKKKKNPPTKGPLMLPKKVAQTHSKKKTFQTWLLGQRQPNLSSSSSIAIDSTTRGTNSIRKNIIKVITLLDTLLFPKLLIIGTIYFAWRSFTSIGLPYAETIWNLLHGGGERDAGSGGATVVMPADYWPSQQDIRMADMILEQFNKMDSNTNTNTNNYLPNPNAPSLMDTLVALLNLMLYLIVKIVRFRKEKETAHFTRGVV